MKKGRKCFIIIDIDDKGRILDFAEADCVEEKIKQIWPRIKEFFGKLSKKTKRLIAVAVATVLIAAVALVVIWANRPYATLFTGLTSEDMSSIVTYLNESGIKNYKIENNDTILVPEAQEPTLKAQLLMQGYPSSDLGYHMYLDNITSLSTESDRRTLFIYDLQDRLASVIRSFDGVQNASVEIAVGEDKSFVLNRTPGSVIEASAAVTVEMDSHSSMNANMAATIRKLVSNAVQGLSIENVSIHDTRGNTWDNDGNLTTTDSATLKLALEEQVNNKIRNNVLTLLGPVYGNDNVAISVNSTVDVSRIYQENINYSTPENAVIGNDGIRGIIGTRVYSYNIGRDEDQTVGGAVGTETNSDLSTYVERNYQPDGQERNLSAEGEDTYDNNKETIQRENAGGTVTDVMVSVVINAGRGTVNQDELIPAIARAAGITVEQQADKVALVVQPWPEEPVEPVIPTFMDEYGWIVYAAIAGAILFLLILLIVILLIRRHRKKKRLAQEAEEAAALAALQQAAQAPEVNADIMDIHTERSMELRKDVRRFAENNPEIAALMVKNWLKEDDEK